MQISGGTAYETFVGEKCVYFFQPDDCICDDPCLSKFGALYGLCPQAGRQFVGLSCVSLVGTSEQNITARSRTHRHLLLKIGQMPTQTAAARGYVLFRSAIRDTHKSPKIVCWLADTFRGVLQTWKDMDHHGCQPRHGRNT